MKTSLLPGGFATAVSVLHLAGQSAAQNSACNITFVRSSKQNAASFLASVEHAIVIESCE